VAKRDSRVYAEGHFDKARETALQPLSRIPDPPRTGYDPMDGDYLREILAATSQAPVMK
jgi:hypothetical protein